MICARAFYGCEGLSAVELPARLEEIGVDAFRASGLESIATPLSTRIIHQGAFCRCQNLKKAVLNRGLEVLGTDEYLDGEMYLGVFEDSALEHVEFPSTLKRIEYSAFKKCKGLAAVQLPDGLETIGMYAFSGSGLESVTTPRSVMTIHQGAFFECHHF